METEKKVYHASDVIITHFYIKGTKLSHRLDGPAYIEHFLNGKLKCEAYYVNDNRHRLDGPAIIWYNEDGSIRSKHYYFDDEDFTSLEKLQHYAKHAILN